MALAVHPGPALSERTTLRLGGPALAEVVLSRVDDAADLAGVLSGLGGRPVVLGRGSNVLAADGPLPLVLVRPAGEPAPRVVRWLSAEVVVRAEAGTGLPKLLGFARAEGFSGMEGLTGIPGSVGGAVAMNAGSYGCETGSVLHRVLVHSERFGLDWRGREQVETGYRRFAPYPGADPGLWLVLAAEFALRRDDPAAVGRRMKETFAKKAATQPLTAHTAGCVFKNPAGESAGRLLDACGFKGKRVGGMGFSPKHANFMENLGGGAAVQALELIAQARAAVRERYGLDLDLEVKLWP
ncbi:MAG: UDP-N-acetylmuramate dehydrogenase [Thermodesulfobacteriota bacterium]